MPVNLIALWVPGYAQTPPELRVLPVIADRKAIHGAITSRNANAASTKTTIEYRLRRIANLTLLRRRAKIGSKKVFALKLSPHLVSNYELASPAFFQARPRVFDRP